MSKQVLQGLLQIWHRFGLLRTYGEMQESQLVAEELQVLQGDVQGSH